MAKVPAPAVDEKIGRKIDWIAACLHREVLKTAGFHKRGRTFWRESGSGAEQARVVVNLQGNKWNCGAQGSFCVNLGVHFPAVTRELAALEEDPQLRDWWLAQADSCEEAVCTVRMRLPDVLPEVLPQPLPHDWPPGLRHATDHWFAVDAYHGLEGVGACVQRLIAEYALPWFERHAVLSAFVDGHLPTLGSPLLARCFGALLLGRIEQARELAREAAGPAGLPPTDFQRRVRARCRALGLIQADGDAL